MSSQNCAKSADHPMPSTAKRIAPDNPPCMWQGRSPLAPDEIGTFVLRVDGYNKHCPRCSEPIEPGQRVVWVDRQRGQRTPVAHVHCATEEDSSFIVNHGWGNDCYWCDEPLLLGQEVGLVEHTPGDCGMVAHGPCKREMYALLWAETHAHQCPTKGDYYICAG